MHDAQRRTPNDAPKPSRADVLRLVGLALCCEHSARKALTWGPHTVRGQTGERIAQAMRALNLRPICVNPEANE